MRWAPTEMHGDDVKLEPAWDGHCHLGPVPGRTPEEKATTLIEYGSRLRVERFVLFMGWPFAYDPSPAELRRQNDQVLQAISHWQDRLFAYCYVNPKQVEASRKEILRCVRDGPMVGLKLWVAVRCTDPRVRELVALAAELQAVVFQHTWLKSTGNLPGESTPEDLVRLAREFPRVTFICGHAGGNWKRALYEIKDQPNIVVETAGFDPTAGFVERAVALLGANRVIFGSDTGGRSLASQLGKVYGAAVDDGARRAILRDNLRRLLEPAVQRKGFHPW